MRRSRKIRRIHPFEAYAARKKHYPRARIRGITITVNPSYITINKHFHPIYIPRETLIPLLRWLIPLVRQMEGDFDPDVAMTAYLAAELEHENEIRRMKGEVRRKKRRGT
jgi:hypothetical protein